MEKTEKTGQDVIVVGAGLSGLAAAYYLKQKGIHALVLEARERCGGRILTVKGEGNDTPVEMGATWFADKHTYLVQLLQELGLPIFHQYQKGIGVFETHPAEAPQYFQIPASEVPSCRVAGGASTLIEALVQKIGTERILLGSAVSQIKEQEDQIEVTTEKGEKHLCRHLVLTIPPFLCVGLEINPALPKEFTSVLENTHTWMGESIKFAVEYERPFWREKGFSGSVFSHFGLIQEMYDHTNLEETRFALKGFLSSSAATFSKEERERAVINQLVRLLGKEAQNNLSYVEKVWQQEEYTYADYGKNILPHQNNGHPVYAQSLMNGKLHLSSSETSPVFGGYMDGAVYSGLATATKIMAKMGIA
ncbi:flavin monoamine oxidase family protein [Rufibacter tibetensis]|uniref:Amine oxidase domain-containing protein n=1 Tax=Rufibacter tibetensis TaxID=512763 RepID=A0A0P0CWJ5_9BACT|nr:FAD-dependent oxidoreductase [Rufibacter tibetensis]ALJ01140.1 hypothetical protein DC20_02330 [Rufibacter tibetensis]